MAVFLAAAAAGAALYSVVLLAYLPGDPAAWTGTVLYLFCFTGAANFPRLRQESLR